MNFKYDLDYDGNLIIEYNSQQVRDPGTDYSEVFLRKHKLAIPFYAVTDLHRILDEARIHRTMITSGQLTTAAQELQGTRNFWYGNDFYFDSDQLQTPVQNVYSRNVQLDTETEDWSGAARRARERWFTENPW